MNPITEHQVRQRIRAYIDRHRQNPLCWYFGCHEEHIDVPCKRCGEPVGYADLAGDTRHQHVKDWLRYWLLRRWFPTRCDDCGKRYGKHEGCLPF